MEYIDAAIIESSKLNRSISNLMKQGIHEITVKNAHSMHNMCVGLTGDALISITDSTGLYTASFLEGPKVVIEGNAGWYAGDDMMDGELIIKNNAGCNVGAYINGGTIVIYGSTGSRVGYGMKGGTILVCGNAGRWAAQMAMGGSLVVIGTVGNLIAESMYRGIVFTQDPDVSAKLGGNVFLDAITEEEKTYLTDLFAKYGVDADPVRFSAIRPALTGRHKYVLFKPELNKLDQKNYQPSKEVEV